MVWLPVTVAMIGKFLISMTFTIVGILLVAIIIVLSLFLSGILPNPFEAGSDSTTTQPGTFGKLSSNITQLDCLEEFNLKTKLTINLCGIELI